MHRRHRVWAAIDLEAFRSNLSFAQLTAKAAAVWPVLKANAYGHGALPLANICEEEAITCIGIGNSGEALELRAAGITTPLLVLGTVIDAELPDLLAHNIQVGVHSEGRAKDFGRQAAAAGKKLGVHLKVDTGMGRLGVRPEAAVRVAQTIMAEPALQLCGVMTHFSSPKGCLDETTAGQQALFQSALTELRENKLPIPAWHCANSAAMFTGLQPLGDAVRPGIGLLGILPPQVDASTHLQPVLSLHAQIVFLKDVPAGTAVGYGSRWTSHRATRLATLPIGYADGLPYRLGAQGRGVVLVSGNRCPIVGAVSMDYCVVDVGHVPGIKLGDTATFIGQQGTEVLSVIELAEAAGTIPYEITCSIGDRVQRLYQKAPAMIS
jgi:alanine racemase